MVDGEAHFVTGRNSALSILGIVFLVEAGRVDTRQRLG
jgi:hypothetical protein